MLTNGILRSSCGGVGGVENVVFVAHWELEFLRGQADLGEFLKKKVTVDLRSESFLQGRSFGADWNLF